MNDDDDVVTDVYLGGGEMDGCMLDGCMLKWQRIWRQVHEIALYVHRVCNVEWVDAWVDA